jgi:REP element-mobilizing transposase RayT
MARPLRIIYSGAFYHVTSRGNERKNIFKSKKDRERFLEYLASATFRYDAVIHTYCLMDNHYHLLLETPSANLSQIMRHINGAYTTYFNIKHKRAGHLFQGRFRAILVDKDAYAKELSRYIHLNPVRAEIVATPENYEWSSYQYYIGLKKSPDWLKKDFILGYFGCKIKEANSEYKKFVRRLLKKEYESPLEQAVGSALLGGHEFIDFIKNNYLFDKKKIKDIPELKNFSRKPELDEIFNTIDIVLNMDPPLARNVKMYFARHYSGKPLKDIAKYFNIGDSGVSQASRRISMKIREDRKLKKKIEQIEMKLSLSRMKS